MTPVSPGTEGQDVLDVDLVEPDVQILELPLPVDEDLHLVVHSLCAVVWRLAARDRNMRPSICDRCGVAELPTVNPIAVLTPQADDIPAILDTFVTVLTPPTL